MVRAGGQSEGREVIIATHMRPDCFDDSSFWYLKQEVCGGGEASLSSRGGAVAGMGVPTPWDALHPAALPCCRVHHSGCRRASLGVRHAGSSQNLAQCHPPGGVVCAGGGYSRGVGMHLIYWPLNLSTCTLHRKHTMSFALPSNDKPNYQMQTPWQVM